MKNSVTTRLIWFLFHSFVYFISTTFVYAEQQNFYQHNENKTSILKILLIDELPPSNNNDQDILKIDNTVSFYIDGIEQKLKNNKLYYNSHILPGKHSIRIIPKNKLYRTYIMNFNIEEDKEYNIEIKLAKSCNGLFNQCILEDNSIGFESGINIQPYYNNSNVAKKETIIPLSLSLNSIKGITFKTIYSYSISRSKFKSAIIYLSKDLWQKRLRLGYQLRVPLSTDIQNKFFSNIFCASILFSNEKLIARSQLKYSRHNYYHPFNLSPWKNQFNLEINPAIFFYDFELGITTDFCLYINRYDNLNLFIHDQSTTAGLFFKYKFGNYSSINGKLCTQIQNPNKGNIISNKWNLAIKYSTNFSLQTNIHKKNNLNITSKSPSKATIFSNNQINNITYKQANKLAASKTIAFASLEQWELFHNYHLMLYKLRNNTHMDFLDCQYKNNFYYGLWDNHLEWIKTSTIDKYAFGIKNISNANNLNCADINSLIHPIWTEKPNNQSIILNQEKASFRPLHILE